MSGSTRSRSNGVLIGLALAAVLAGGWATPASAAPLYWTGAGAWDDGTTFNWSAIPGGVSGVYTDANWAGGSGAVFEGTAGAVTVDLAGIASVGSITLAKANYTIGGGNVKLTGTGGYITAVTGTGTINSIIDGTVGLTKAGAGTLVIAGENTYTGTTVVNCGTLQVGSGTAGSINGTAGTALTFTGTGIFNVKEAASSTQGMGTLTFSAGDGTVQSTFNATAATLTFSDVAARTAGATGNFIQSGGAATTNMIVLTSFAGGATPTGALLDKGLFFGGSKYAAYDAGGYVRGISYDGTEAPSPLAGQLTDLGTITSTTNLQYSGGAAGTAVNITTTSGSTTATLNSGTVILGQMVTGATVPAGACVTNISGTTLTLSMPGVNGSGTGNVTPYPSVSDQPTGSLNTLNLVGTNAAILLGTGQTLSIDGILKSGGTTGAINGGTGIQTNASGGELVIRADLAADTVCIGSPILDNGGSSLTKSGAGTLRITTAANTYTGGTVINAGTLAIGVSSLVDPLGSGTTTVNSGGTLALNRTNMSTALVLNGGTVTAGNSFTSNLTGGTITLNAVSTINVTGNLTIGSNISGVGGIIKTGAAVVPVTGTNTYTGPTTITGGALKFKSSLYSNDPAQWTPANITVGNGASLVLNVGGTGEFTVSQAGTLFANLATNVNNNGLQAGSLIGIDISGAGATVQTWSNTIADATGAGAGAVGIKIFGLNGNTRTMELTGPNTYTGLTIVDGDSTLKVSSINSVATNPGLGTVHLASSSLGAPTTVANGTIWLGTSSTYKGGNLTYTGTGETTDRVINLGGANNSVYTFDQSGSGLLKFISDFTMTDRRGPQTIVLQGSNDLGSGEMACVLPTGDPTNGNRLTKSGTGTWTLSGANLYSGITTLTGGVLSVATISDGGLTPTLTTVANSATVTASSTAGLVVGQAVTSPKIPIGRTVASILDGTTFTLNSGTGVTAGAAQASTIGMPSNLGIARPTASYLVFNGGALQYTGADASTNRNFTINNGKTATFDIITLNNLTLTGASTATTGLLTKIGSGTLTLAGANLYTGNTTVSQGKLLLGQGGAMAATAVSVDGTGTYGTAYTSSSNNIAGGKSLSMVGTKLDMRDNNTNILSFTTTGTLDGADLYFDLGTAAGVCDTLAMVGAAAVANVNTFHFNALGSDLALGTYTLITADGGGLSTGGTFDLVNTLPKYKLTLDASSGTAVYLNVALSIIPGDTNEDKVVDAADFITLKKNFGAGAGGNETVGNFDKAGTVDWTDLGTLMTNMGAGSTAPAATPEPATLFVMMAAGLPALLKRRRRVRA